MSEPRQRGYGCHYRYLLAHRNNETDENDILEDELDEARAELAALKKRMTEVLRIDCDKCHRPLGEPGGLLFDPPDSEGRARKHHICVRCLVGVHALLKPEDPAP